MSEKTAADSRESKPERDEVKREQRSEPEQEQQADDGAAGQATAEASGLEAELEATRNKAEDNWNQYLRAVAELENTRKRASRDIEHAHRFALERFATELLPVKDSLEMGLNAASDANDKTDALLEGTAMTLKQLAQAFEKFGIAEIDPKAERFDPEQHEAMATQPSSEAEPGTVLTVVQKGYLLNGRVLRPARVLVAREPDEDQGGEGA